MSELGTAASTVPETAAVTDAKRDVQDLYAFLILKRNEQNPSIATILSPANSASAVTGTPVTLSGSTSQPQIPATYHWDVLEPDTGTGRVMRSLGDGATLDVSFTKVGNHDITLTLQPIGGGTPSVKPVTINVAAPTPPPVNAVARITKSAPSAVLGTPFTVSGITSTPTTGATYEWSMIEPPGVTKALGDLPTFAVPFTKEGPHTITLIVRPGGAGASSTLTIPVSVAAAPAPIVATAIISSPPDKKDIVVGNTAVIVGETSTPQPGLLYRWSVLNPANETSATTFETVARHSLLLSTTGKYIVTLTVQTPAGTTSTPVSIEINAIPLPEVLTPGYLPNGFEALSGFSAAANSSQTRCPTIQNSGTGTLVVSFTGMRAAGSSADFSGYFEFGDNASCPSTPRACNTSAAAGSPISGSTSLAAPADPVCTLALRFNPAKLGEAGGLGARSATLRIAHNGPAGTVVDVPLSGNVTPTPQPGVGLSTNPGVVNGRVAPPAFAAQVVNTASAAWNEILVFNIGTADGLDITEIISSNTQEFALTENCISMAPLARISGNDPHCTIGLRFTPSATGERCTTVTVRAAVGGNAVVQICGTGVAAPEPDLTLSRDAIDFGRRFLNAAYPPQALVISNGAGATDFLRINAVTLVGPGFTLVAQGATSPDSCRGVSLAPGASCTLQVQFTPDPAKPDTPYSASLQIDTNDVSTPRRTVSLAAIAGTAATPPVLQFANTPAQIEFADVVVAGQQSAQSMTATLRNAGPGNATVEAIRMVGADASSFSAGGCPATLVEGSTCVISVRFTPGSGGQKRAQLEVLSSASVPPALLTVTGRSVGGTSAFLTASSVAASLGGVRVGAQSTPFEVRLASAGDGVIRITDMQADAPFTVQSKTCPAVPFTLPRGGDCTVTVTFTPTDARTATASLRISTDADTRPLVVQLTGNGEEKANLSSGGCSIASGDAPFDPTLWALVLLAIGAIVYRRRVRAAGRQR